MGLDITAYTKLKECPSAPLNDEGFPDDELFHAPVSTIEWTEKHFPGRTAGLKPGMVYDYEDSFGFRAGSYGGYGAWRNWLAKLAGFESSKAVWDNETTTGPFVELINFADNEGIIGPVVAAKLAIDFGEYELRAESVAQTSNEEWYLEVYRHWLKAFRMAADDGAVSFH